MSAYIVDRNTITYLVKAAEHFDMYWNDNRLKRCEDGYFVLLAQMLWDENIKSVQYLYPDCRESLANAPGPIGEDFKIVEADASKIYPSFNGWTILRACQTYEYQSCEHPTWDNSEAKRFIECLTAYALRRVTPEDVPPVPKAMNARAIF